MRRLFVNCTVSKLSCSLADESVCPGDVAHGNKVEKGVLCVDSSNRSISILSTLSVVYLDFITNVGRTQDFAYKKITFALWLLFSADN